jgi:hypothetical protein
MSLLAAATKQGAREGTGDWEDLACTVVRRRMRELMTALQLFVHYSYV